MIQFRSILTLKDDQKFSHSGRELDVLEFDLRKSDDVSRGKTAGSVESRYASSRATRIVARHSFSGGHRYCPANIHCSFVTDCFRSDDQGVSRCRLYSSGVMLRRIFSAFRLNARLSLFCILQCSTVAESADSYSSLATLSF